MILQLKFWGSIWLWLTGTRRWEIVEDFYFFLNGEEYVIEKGFEFDGASVPKFLAMWLSPVGVLLMGGLVHDYGYKYAELVKKKDNETVAKTQKEMDVIFSRYLYRTEWIQSIKLFGLLVTTTSLASLLGKGIGKMTDKKLNKNKKKN